MKNKYLASLVLILFFSIELYSQCASVYFLRVKGGFQSNLKASIIYNDKPLFTVDKGNRYKINLCETGEHSFSASASTTTLGYFSKKNITIEEGKSYYIRVKVIFGVDEPVLTLMDESKGKKLLSSDSKFSSDLEEITIGESKSNDVYAVEQTPNNVLAPVKDEHINPSLPASEEIARVGRQQVRVQTKDVPLSHDFWHPVTEKMDFEKKCYNQTTVNPPKKVVANCDNTLLLLPEISSFYCDDPENLKNILLKSRDGGKSWTDITSSIPYIKDIFLNNRRNLTIQDVAIEDIYAVKNDFYLFIGWGVEGAILKSSNGGVTWELVCDKIPRSWHHNIEILHSGRIIQKSCAANNTFVRLGALEECSITEWDSVSGSWIIVKESKIDQPTGYRNPEFVFRSLKSDGSMQEYMRVKNFNKGDERSVRPEDYNYYESMDKGANWQEVALYQDYQLWVNPWKIDRRERKTIFKDNYFTEYIREANGNLWKPIYKYKHGDDYGWFSASIGADGYSYAVKDSILYKSKSRIYSKNVCNDVDIDYGTTIITHGIMPPNVINYSEDNWVRRMANAILDKVEQGSIYYCDADNGKLEFIKSRGDNPEHGEKIVLFDWSKYCVLLDPLYAELAAEKLYLALAHLNEPIFGDTLKNVHLIGEGFGAIVNSLAVERLSQLNRETITIDQMTHIAPREYSDEVKQIKIWNDVYTDIYQCEYDRLPFYEELVFYAVKEYAINFFKGKGRKIGKTAVIASEIIDEVDGYDTYFNGTAIISDINSLVYLAGLDQEALLYEKWKRAKNAVTFIDFVFKYKERQEVGVILPFKGADHYILDDRYDFFPDGYTESIKNSIHGESEGKGYAFSRLNKGEEYREETFGKDYPLFSLEGRIPNGQLNSFYEDLPAWLSFKVQLGSEIEIKDNGLIKHDPFYFPEVTNFLTFKHRGNGNLIEGTIAIDFYDIDDNLIQGESKFITIDKDYLSWENEKVPIDKSLKGKVGSFSLVFIGKAFDESIGEAGVIIDSIEFVKK